MNEQASWIFYRYAVGAGTLFLGVAAILGIVYLRKIALELKEINKKHIVLMETSGELKIEDHSN